MTQQGEPVDQASQITVEVAYALADQQKIIKLQVAAGSTPYEAAVQSEIITFFPQIDLENDKMGVFGKAVKAKKHVLVAGDRVEIYRPLLADPKESRKARAAKAKDKRAGDEGAATEELGGSASV